MSLQTAATVMCARVSTYNVRRRDQVKKKRPKPPACSEYFVLSYNINVKTTTNDRFMTNQVRHM